MSATFSFLALSLQTARGAVIFLLIVDFAIENRNLKIENPWRGVGVAYRAALERLCRVRPYRGFESRPLRYSNTVIFVPNVTLAGCD